MKRDTLGSWGFQGVPAISVVQQHEVLAVQQEGGAHMWKEMAYRPYALLTILYLKYFQNK